MIILLPELTEFVGLDTNCCGVQWIYLYFVQGSQRMSSVPSGKRQWKCPECGSDELLSMTQLDPIACASCVARMKGAPPAERTVTESTTGPLGVWQALPDTTKLAVVAVAFALGLLLGLLAGFLTGKFTAPHTTNMEHTSTGTFQTEKEEVRPEPPGPNYKWVRGRERKDGTRSPGHWAKDPFYKGEDSPAPKKK